MKLQVSKSANAIIYYVAETFRNGNKTASRLVEKIGTHQELLDKGIKDPKAYAQNRVNQINQELKNSVLSVNQNIDLKTSLEPLSIESKDITQNIGWLYIHEMLRQLGVEEYFRKEISTKAQYDVYAVFEYYVANRFLFPGSKREAFLSRDKFFGAPDFSLHDGYRALTLLNKCDEDLQSVMYKGCGNISPLETDVLYYDCTNFYFETEEEDDNTYNEDGDIIQWGLRRYGEGKEHRPNPIVQMGLFTDKNGIPISYCIHHGSNNEQNTVIPLERRMLKDYAASKFIYCSDGGLGSYDNRFFNTLGGRDYVVTQSLKKTKEEELSYIFKDLNWKFLHNDKNVSLEAFKSACDKLMSGAPLTEKEQDFLNNDIIYKKYPIKRKIPAKFLGKFRLRGNVEVEEDILITFSAKYYLYQRHLMQKQLEEATRWLNRDPDSLKKGPNDIRRFIKTLSVTQDGELATNKSNEIDNEVVTREMMFHGFYAVATSLDKPAKDILDINASRWRIEQSFRILKSDFDSRPVFVSTPEHIRAHFLICYTALLIYRLLERNLNSSIPNEDHFTTNQILNTIRNMNVLDQKLNYSQSVYTGSLVLDSLEKIFKKGLNKKYYKTSYLEKLFRS